MDLNSSPSPLPEDPVKKPKRPAYLGWLIGYLVLYGGILLALQLFAFRNLVESGVELDSSPTFILVSILFLGILGIAGGIGLWLGKKWGWWLSTFYFLYALSREANTLINPASSGLEPTRSWLSAGLGILLSIVVLLYLYSHEILVHFHLEKFPRWISLLILLVAAVIVTLLL
jgi:hypothetical protein